MASEPRGLWFVTDVETSETVKVVEGGRRSEDAGGGFGSSAVQAVRKSLTQRVQIDADDLKRQIGNLTSVVSDVFDQTRAETGLLWIRLSCRSRSVPRAGQHPRHRRQAGGQGRDQAEFQARRREGVIRRWWWS